MPRCWFCGSTDSMPPFKRSGRVFLLTALFRRLRWSYCRNCARHFLIVLPRRREELAADSQSAD